jgi:hypothetical protein
MNKKGLYMFNFDPFREALNTLSHFDNIFNIKNKDLNELNLDSLLNVNFDEMIINKYSKCIIAGYLNLKKIDGWDEGGDSHLGALFIRLIVKKYLTQTEGCLGVNKIVFEQAFKGLQENQNLPLTTRVSYDPSIRGWQSHAVTRLIGNLSSTYDSSKPMFEILINSARSTAESNFGHPFFISIHKDAKELENRRRLLASLRMASAELAHYSFYASYLKKPEQFLKENQEHLGPNSTRILNGLIYLQNVELNTQRSGNCWIKQPMRCFLVNLYIELLTHRKELSFEQAWNQAKELYKHVQKVVAIPYVTQLLQNEPITFAMKESALRELEAAKCR